jgi:hypothetical protein
VASVAEPLVQFLTVIGPEVKYPTIPPTAQATVVAERVASTLTVPRLVQPSRVTVLFACSLEANIPAIRVADAELERVILPLFVQFLIKTEALLVS